MNWMSELLKVYDAALPNIEEYLVDNPPLIPVCHNTQLAQIEVSIKENGEFFSAKVIPKEFATTVIPCTEDSAGRTSKPSPHPLHDKLQYVAGDYEKYGGTKKSGFTEYKKLITDWCNQNKHDSVDTVRKYVSQGNLIFDLVKCGVLFTGPDQKLVEKESAEDAEIFKVFNGAQEDAFVRWKVLTEIGSEIWKEKSVWDSWKEYYMSTMDNRGICSVTGEETILASNHPSKMRNSGDKAKIISSNDAQGFTYRGRFSTPEQVCGVGYEISQKAHSALRWLIGRQGYRNEDLAIVSWTESGSGKVKFVLDASAFYGNKEEISTGDVFAKKLNKNIRGYYADVKDTDSIAIMALNSATTGRLSILMYRELTGSDFIGRIFEWNNSCAWIHRYRFEKTEKGNKHIVFEGAPSPRDMAKAAYGDKADSKVINHAIERILPCIIDGVDIPGDIVNSAVQRASNPLAMEKYEWNKTMSIACSLFKKSKPKEEYDMVLDETRSSRDYLYGRLLAVADQIESWALREANEDRQTNARRFMQKFRESPYRTWVNIEMSLAPYVARLRGKAGWYEMKISEIMNMFDADDFVNDRRLSGEFLLGFHSQKEAFFAKKEAEDDDRKEE